MSATPPRLKRRQVRGAVADRHAGKRPRIQPAECDTYRFKLPPLGTDWNYSHVWGHNPDGPFGPLIVEKPNYPYSSAYDYARVIVINDWFHRPSEEILANLRNDAHMHMDKDSDGAPDVAAVSYFHVLGES